MTSEEHKARVLGHQAIAQLFACSLEELFVIYQQTDPQEDADTTWTCMVYSIGQWRFGRQAWSHHHTEFFKERARQNAAGGGAPGRTTKRDLAKRTEKLSLADLGL